MKFSTSIPPIYYRLRATFGVEWEDGIVITYGDTVHCIRPLTPDLIPHEQTHMKQQAQYGIDWWWDKYLNDKAFRFEQELEAYRNQVAFIKTAVKDRNQRFSILHRLCLDLSGTMYGKLCTYSDAMRLLR